MLVKEFLQQLEKLRASDPNVDEMEIGPVFWNHGGIIMTIESVNLFDNHPTKDNVPEKVVGIHWSC